ncbi:hypothetical protein D3C71_1918810 [compost metagenome]
MRASTAVASSVRLRVRCTCSWVTRVTAPGTFSMATGVRLPVTITWSRLVAASPASCAKAGLIALASSTALMAAESGLIMLFSPPGLNV